jgi:tetratricopeptide (TPR) repeat protein
MQLTMNVTQMRIILITLVALVLASCGSQTTEESIVELEAKFKEVTSGNGINQEEVKDVILKLAAAYETYASENPENPSAPEYLYKSAELYETNMMDINKAMAIFDKIIADYPDNERAADALFKKGYVYHNTLKDLDKAREAYMSFLEKYPDHELSSSAKFEIDNLGVSAKELLEKIQQNASEDSEPTQ